MTTAIEYALIKLKGSASQLILYNPTPCEYAASDCNNVFLASAKGVSIKQ